MSSESTYTITRDNDDILRVAFGEPGGNDQIVKDAHARLDAIQRTGELSGGLLKINGPLTFKSTIKLRCSPFTCPEEIVFVATQLILTIGTNPLPVWVAWHHLKNHLTEPISV